MTNSEKKLGAQAWKSLAKEVSLDLWICRRFHVLPTEQRFQRLTPNQKALLFYGYLETPTDDAIYDAYHQSELVSSEVEEQFSACGYTEEQIERIKRNLKLARLI